LEQELSIANDIAPFEDIVSWFSKFPKKKNWNDKVFVCGKENICCPFFFIIAKN
jgi:hypothetical protein